MVWQSAISGKKRRKAADVLDAHHQAAAPRKEKVTAGRFDCENIPFIKLMPSADKGMQRASVFSCYFLLFIKP